MGEKKMFFNQSMDQACRVLHVSISGCLCAAEAVIFHLECSQGDI